MLEYSDENPCQVCGALMLGHGLCCECEASVSTLREIVHNIADIKSGLTAANARADQAEARVAELVEVCKIARDCYDLRVVEEFVDSSRSRLDELSVLMLEKMLAEYRERAEKGGE